MDPTLSAMALCEALGEGVIAFDQDCRYTLWSPSMERLSGLPASEVLGQHAFTLFPFLVETGEDRCFRQALAGQRVVSHVRPFTIPGSERRGLFKARYYPVRDGSGAVTGGVGLIRDVTAAHELGMRESTEEVELVFQASGVGPWRWDEATDLVTYGRRAAEILGLERGRKTSWTRLMELVHQDDRAALQAATERAMEEREDFELEYRVLRPGGDEVWVAAQGRALYDGQGQVLGMIGVLQDVNSRKQAEQALLEETRALETVNHIGQLLVGELDLHTLLQALTDAATQICDAQFGAFFYNVLDERGEQYMLYTLSGAPREAFERYPVPRNTSLFGPTFRGEGVLRLDDVTRDPRYGRNPPYHGMPAGHLPVCSYLAVPVVARDGRVLGGLFFGHGQCAVFTARHERLVVGLAAQAAIALDNARLYKEAREHAAQLALADRRKDEFLATLAHELRNPLGAISNALHVMSLVEPSHPAHGRAFAVALRQVSQQTRLVDDLLDVSRIAEGKIRLQEEILDLADVVRQTAADHTPAMENSGLRLYVELEASELRVRGDRARLVQAVGNLLDNARKFTPQGGQITVRLRQQDGEAFLSVSDTGAGLDPDGLPGLFAPFSQADRTLDRSQGGLGLGLALVKGLIELHEGGQVTAHSAGPGQGATFTLRLALAAPEAPLGRDPTPACPGVVYKRVLVIEDISDHAETLSTLLSLHGYDPQVARSGEEGLELARRFRPDVVLCDIGLAEGMSGYDVARQLRSEGDISEVRLVAITGYGADEDKRRSQEAGFDLHLTKPVQPHELLSALEGLDRTR
jgi:PAS domain S-box-containing protein